MKHYSEVWNIVKQCKKSEAAHDAAVGNFDSSAFHFAKHCINAKSKKDVVHWCEDHVKVEKWTMVCRTCLGTSIDTTNAKRGIVSFKTEHNMK